MSEANPKNRGLGRGLNALFEDDEEFTGVGEPSAPAGKGGLKVGIERTVDLLHELALPAAQDVR